MMPYEVLEIGMLVCFSIGWLWSVGRMLAIRRAIGKSPGSILFICSGYLCGIGAKTAMWHETGELSPLVWVYCWNLALVLFDLALVLHFTRKERHGSRFRINIAS